MNKHDSEKIAGILETCGYIADNDISTSDLVIYYTCCVRESADKRFFGQLSSTKYKDGAQVAVGGCLAQKEGAKLLKRFKNVDLVFGTQNLQLLPDMLAKLDGEPLSNTKMLADFNSDLATRRESAYKAWIAINRGCDNHCTYCIVPSVRGPEKSRDLDDITKEAKELVNDGVLEITLLGQNVNSYGSDIYGKPSLASLLRKLSETGIERLRFTTSHPKDLSKDIVEVIKAHDNICNHIHLPVQAGSDRVLKKMGRKYTKKHYLALLDLLHNNIENVSITTDIMVGFPGESDSDFNETLDLVQKAQFDQAFTFIYSTREGTAAAHMTSQLPYYLKLNRFKQLTATQDEISWKKNKALKSKIVEVLVDGGDKKHGRLFGRTKTNKLVHFDGTSDLTGKLVNVNIKEAKPFFLVGDLIE